LTAPGVSWGQGVHQAEVDAAYSLIFQTQMGKAVCRQILGGDREAIRLHLGVSVAASATLAAQCPKGAAHKWIYPTRPEDIRKLSLKDARPRAYKVLVSSVAFPIESWTEPFTNTTVLVTPVKDIPIERWVQILAHETAVYFDSKANPAHPDAQQIPELRALAFNTPAKMDPLIAFSNPLHGHAMTYVRALQVEYEILLELVRAGKLRVDGLFEPTQNLIISERCGHECLQRLVVRLRATLSPISLPLLAFAPHYRSLILQELPRTQVAWPEPVWQRAQQVLNHLPVDFLKTQFGGDPVADMKRVFYANASEQVKFNEVAQFLEHDLWPVEQVAVFETQLRAIPLMSLLEFMKAPLLSGYNVGLSSGPRVRIRTGNIE